MSKYEMFHRDRTFYVGPPLTEEMVQRAEASLGYRLPRALVGVLKEQNGGVPKRRWFPVTRGEERELVELRAFASIGGSRGMDNEDGGSAYLIEEWGYPKIGIVFCHMPSGGHDALMLDYSRCGPEGEPAVVYVDDDRDVLPVAESFDAFLNVLCVEPAPEAAGLPLVDLDPACRRRSARRRVDRPTEASGARWSLEHALQRGAHTANRSQEAERQPNQVGVAGLAGGTRLASRRGRLPNRLAARRASRAPGC